ncbi:cytochrome [Streptomyces sp. SAT1]|nr:cytochrome [Streptomyces sp. SAT1]
MSEQPVIVLDPTGSDHHAEDRASRARGAGARVDILGVSAWAVTDPALLERLLTSPDVSKDAVRHWAALSGTAAARPLALWVTADSMFTAYGTDHRRLPRMIAPAFGARRIEAPRPGAESTVAALLDALAALSAGEGADLRARFAHPLPIAVISRLMGVPESRRDGFRAGVDGIFDATVTAEQAAANGAAVFADLKGADRPRTARAARRHDLPGGRGPRRGGDGGGLSGTELRDTLPLMLSAAYETTVNAIDQAVTALLRDTSQLARVRAGQADRSDVVEERVRHEPAVKHLPLRYAVKDIPLPGDQIIPRGDAILASYAAANRHPDRHGPGADRFDVTRPVKDHMAFEYGVHSCLGAPLARMEAATTLRRLFDRFPGIELAVSADRLRPLRSLRSLISNGYLPLPVRLRRPRGRDIDHSASGYYAPRLVGAAPVT